MRILILFRIRIMLVRIQGSLYSTISNPDNVGADPYTISNQDNVDADPYTI